MNILAVEPYFGGSHRVFLESLRDHSRHTWKWVTGEPRHWKWRMRSSPASLFEASVEQFSLATDRPEVIFCSDMLDVPAWLGFVSRHSHEVARAISACPLITYFHESQWTYPVRSERVDHYPGYTNLLSALASDECWFNSQFHLDTFLEYSESFLKRMPDSKSDHDMAGLRDRCRVYYPGFQPAKSMECARQDSSQKICIGWVARWEHDKRPDQFVELLRELRKRGVDFSLVLLGSRLGDVPDLVTIQSEFQSEIQFDGYAENAESYQQCLRMMDLVVSTADHEFFGIGVCEAVSAGAVPVLPDRLSYPELFPNNQRYTNLSEAASIVESMQNTVVRREASEVAVRSVSRFETPLAVSAMDDAIDVLVL